MNLKAVGVLVAVVAGMSLGLWASKTIWKDCRKNNGIPHCIRTAT